MSAAHSNVRPNSETPKEAPGEIALDGAHLAFIRCVERLEQLVDRETQALKASAPLDFEDFNIRKTHALLEFLRATRSLSGQASTAIETRLARLRARLAENSLMLDHHLGAMREISGIMIRTIETAESDGTYSKSSCNRQSGFVA